MRVFLTAILVLNLCSVARAAASDVENLLGIVPGQPSKFRTGPFASGAPFEIYRMPTRSPRLAPIFVDLEFMVSSASGRVVGAGGKRAYLDKRQCEDAQNTARSVLSKVFPSKYTGPDPRWQFQSADGGITAGAYCSSASGAPYPVLEMDITHTATNEEILKHFKRSPPRPAADRTR